MIAGFLAAESRGEPADREELLDRHPELADSLRDFFVQHDRSTSAIDTPTLSREETQGSESRSRESRAGEHQDPTLLGDRTLADGGPGGASEDGKSRPRISSSAASKTSAEVTIDQTVSAHGTGTEDVAGGVRYFGDHELLEEIARGGMGVVFKARQMNLNRIVALKMILAGQFAGDKDVQRFRTEAESAAQLDHPGIVPIFEIGHHDGQHFFSMGYVEGESLADRVSEGPLPPKEAAELLQKISTAMAYAHGRGVIHRDLKPANVLIDEQGQPKITDFGLAKKTEADSDLTGTGQILGTPAYMPPEQAGGKVDQVGPLADVYSLGAILYCLLTGRPPFQAANPMDALRQVLDRDPVSVRQLVPTIPRDLETICGKCLSKDPAKRYESAADLADDLQRYLDDQPIIARPAGRVERASKWASKQPAIAAILLTMPAWLLGEPKIGVGLLALIAGFHLPFRFRFFRLLVVMVIAIMAAITIGLLAAAFVMTDSDSSGSVARMAAISILSTSAPAGALLFVFLFDCVSQLRQPYQRRAKWALVASAVASLMCIAGFMYYLRFHSEQISAIVDQLESDILSLTTGSQLEGSTDEPSSEAMMQLFRSRNRPLDSSLHRDRLAVLALGHHHRSTDSPFRLRHWQRERGQSHANRPREFRQERRW